MRRKRKCTILVYRIIYSSWGLDPDRLNLSQRSTNCSIRLIYGSCVSSFVVEEHLEQCFHFRNFFTNSFSCNLFIFAFVPFLVQRTRTRKKLILNNLIVGASVWKDSIFFFYNWIRMWDSCFSRLLYSLVDLSKRGWSHLSGLFRFRWIQFFLTYNSQKWDSVSFRLELLIRRIFEIVIAIIYPNNR